MDFEIDNEFIRIHGIGFFGQFSRSRNGRFILGWADYDPASGRGGARKEGLGSYVLIDGADLILRGNMQRPNDGKVSDNGTFVLNDWMFSDDLSGTFYAISPSGEVLVQKRFKANLFNNGISDDGRLAVCQTCNSDYEPHSSILAVYDLEKKSVLGQFIPLTGWGEQYRFDLADQLVQLIYDNGRSYRYKFDGTCIDVGQWHRDRELFGSGYDLLSIAETRLQAPQSSELSSYSEVIGLLKRSLEKGVSDYTQARIHRLLGEIYHRCGEKNLAIDHLANALRLNPKVGIKKLYESLKSS
jgi:hypothetical protein